MGWVDWGLTLLNMLVLLPILVLLVETIAASLPARPKPLLSATSRPVCAVLIPAHNEEIGITNTLQNVLRELIPGDRILVIADNCTDTTATIAASLGVEVLERMDTQRRGKGFALEFGLNHLAQNPPPFVVILDADCLLEPGSLSALVDQSAESEGVRQGIYLPGGNFGADVRKQWSAFAIRFKNEVRPYGLYRLGLPCLLTGSGMVFPWKAILSINWGTSDIVEDMKLGIDLSLRKFAPQLCPGARVFSEAPPSEQGAIKQRMRWEHGHVQTILSQVPRLLWGAIRQGRPALVGLALELAVPPLSLLILVLIAIGTGSLSWWQLAEGSPLPAWMSLAGLSVLILTISLAWGKYGRGIVPIKSFMLLPVYILWKVPIYLRLVGKREKNWVRTERADPG